jgi:hypothetical protein
MKVWKTLHRWLQLGVFEQEGETVHLTPKFERIELDDVEAMRTAVLELVLRPENNRGIDQAQGDDEAERSGASDFTRAAAWALAQDPFALTAESDVVLFARKQQVTPDLFANDTRWFGFKDWAHFLGIALPLGGKDFVVNPARAVRAVLDTLWSHEGQLPIGEFLTRLSAVLPVLDGGTYRATVGRQVRRPWRSLDAFAISPCLSLALLQLRHEGLIRLEDLADPRNRMTLLGRSGRSLESVTHVAKERP